MKQASPVVRAAACAAATLWLAGCGTPPAPAGTSRADMLRSWGAPTARHDLGAGAERLEYASGPYGRMTWMVDIDSSGRVVQSRQVLNEAEFQRVQAAPALTREALLRWLGTPGERRRGGRAGGEVWSWRYPTNDCLWFQSSVADDGSVTGSAYAIDPRCDAPSRD